MSEPACDRFPVFSVADKYLVYSPEVVLNLRRKHNICGVLIGTLSQVPQQNVFQGLPLQLMPEEARVLVDNGHAYIVDDPERHSASFLEGRLDRVNGLAFADAMQKQGYEAALAVSHRAKERREVALRRLPQHEGRKASPPSEAMESLKLVDSQDTEHVLFSTPAASDEMVQDVSKISASTEILPFLITPTVSEPPLVAPIPSERQLFPQMTASYKLFAHLHHLGYFMMPGLRFGCHYNVYPGDPLRFHSHFLAVGKRWHEHFHIMEIVAGGRLGTSVKKGFMLGGEVEISIVSSEGEDVKSNKVADRETRVFCFEWAGM